MPGLVRIDLEPVAARLRSLLPAFGVAGAYIFGSALEEARPDSDVDVGLIRRDALDPEADPLSALAMAEAVADEMGAVQGHPCHVSVLSLRAPFLAFEAVHTGRLVYEEDEGLVTDFIEEVSLRYRDDYPRYRTALREIEATP
jgi:predicted nucleotidyltransferase